MRKIVDTKGLLQILQYYFGYSSFRSPQDQVIESIMSGQDTFVLLPTGAGKSLCYQLPAVALPGLTIVVSPLIALMKDQVDHLTAHGISAACLNSTMSQSEQRDAARKVIRNQLKLLYLAPERLAKSDFISWLQRQHISLIAIDEAHCISEWGHDFRPEYRQLAKLRSAFPGIPMIALTATAIPKAKQDILQQLDLKNPKIFQTSFNRPNLHYILRPKTDQWNEVQAWLKKYKNDSIVIYCLSRKATEYLAVDLMQAGYKAKAYHAGLAKNVRAEIQGQFAKDKIQIVVATIAFGMGIDKPNIRLVIHYDMPKSMEGYYQETGRAGRDGLLSHCVMFYGKDSPDVHRRFIERMDNSARHLAERKLSEMIKYCDSQMCRRKFVLYYFAEDFVQENCQGCDRCVEEYQKALKTEKIGTKEINHDSELFEKLRALRKQFAEAENVPAFVIFSDFSLKEMATYFPNNLNTFAQINGVGEFKLRKYGPTFVQFIAQNVQDRQVPSTISIAKTRLRKLEM